ncbi:MAG: hypothetical protein RL021_565 [Bacteroidota bacterium]
MRAAQWTEREAVIRLIAETFADNPALDWMIRPGGKRKKRLLHFSEYAFRHAWVREGVWISDNGKAAALAFHSDRNPFDLLSLLLWLRLGITTLRLRRVPELLRREKYRKRIRPEHPYFYIWFLGARPGNDRAAFEMKSGLFGKAKTEGLRIYFETSVFRNKQAFEYAGFETYHHLPASNGSPEFWFMRSQIVAGG